MAAGLADAGGATLVELLVALSIFGLLMLTAAYTFRMAGSLLQKTERRHARETRLLSGLRDSLAGSYHYVGERRALSPGHQEYYYHFYGGPREIDYVSSRPLSAKGLALTRLCLQDRALLLEETPLFNLKNDFKAPVLPVDGGSPIVLLTDLESFGIEYLSAGRWSNAVEETLPEAVRISYKKPNSSEARELFVRIKGNFSDKKDFMEALSPMNRKL
jgi:hypothetical protein